MNRHIVLVAQRHRIELVRLTGLLSEEHGARTSAAVVVKNTCKAPMMQLDHGTGLRLEYHWSVFVKEDRGKGRVTIYQKHVQRPHLYICAIFRLSRDSGPRAVPVTWKFESNSNVLTWSDRD